jgi:hypothetical protein
MLSEHKPIAVAQLVVLALPLVLVACGSGDEATPADTPATADTPAATTEPAPTTEAPPATPATTIDWQNYAPHVQTRIDGLGQAKDCAGPKPNSTRPRLTMTPSGPGSARGTPS